MAATRKKTSRAAKTRKKAAGRSKKSTTKRSTTKKTRTASPARRPTTRKKAARASKKKASRRGGAGRGRRPRSTYSFSPGSSDGDGSMKALLGGKGANLAEMCRIGLPVPPGFTITTAICAAYYDAGRTLPVGLMDDIERRVRRLERETGKAFGDAANPLLVSVRSGAAVSMPGMMDTVLNLGLNDDAVRGLAELTGNPRFAYDAYRRLINMYGDVVMGIDHAFYEAAFDTVKRRYNATLDTDVPVEGLIELCEAYQDVYREHVRKPFPQDPMAQLRHRILRERLADVLPVDVLVGLTEFDEPLDGDVRVERGVVSALHGVEGGLIERMVDAHDDVAVHVDEPAVGVVGEPGVAGQLGEPAHGVVIEPEVQDRVHHAGHGDGGARADRHQ